MWKSENVDFEEKLVKEAKLSLHLDTRIRKRGFVPLSPQAAETRKQLLQERKNKLNDKHERVKSVKEKKSLQEDCELKEKREKMILNFVAVENRRMKIIESQKQHYNNQVRKAKEVALCKQQELANLRKQQLLEIERKQLESEYRRRNLMKLPKSQVISNSANLTKMMEDSANLIQSWWMKVHFTKLSKLFCSLNLDLQKLKEESPNQIQKVVTDPKVLKATHMLIKSSIKSLSLTVKNPTRLFYSAFLMIADSGNGEGESGVELPQLSHLMIQNFISWTKVISSRELMLAFVSSFKSYYEAFQAWKLKDQEKMVSEIMESYLEFELLWMSVKGNKQAEAEWGIRIRNQQKVAKDRLKMIGGEEALVRLDRMLSEKGLEEKENSGSVDSVVRSADVEHNELVDPPTNSDIPATESLLSNVELAHEIFLNSSFDVKKYLLEKRAAQGPQLTEEDSTKEKIRLVKLMQVNQNWIPLLEFIKKSLLRMAFGKSAQVVKEGLDIELIVQEIEHKVFDYCKCLSFVLMQMKLLCAPVRDDAIKELEKGLNVFELANQVDNDGLPAWILQLLDVLELMSQDLMTYSVNQIKPILSKEITEYERNHFTSKYKEIPITVKWLQDSLKRVESVRQERNPENLDLSKIPLMADTFVEGVMELLNPQCKFVPETFLLDSNRIQKYRQQIEQYSFIATFMLTISHKFQISQQSLSRIHQLLQGELSKDNLIAELQSLLPKVELKAIREFVNQLNFANSIYKIVLRRILAVLKGQICTKKIANSLEKQGLQSVEKQVVALSSEVEKMVNHNRSVYAPFYDQIIKESQQLK